MNSTSSDIIEPTDWHDTRVSTIDRNRNYDSCVSYRDGTLNLESECTPSQSKNSSFIHNSSFQTGQPCDETDFFNLSNNSSNKTSSPQNRQVKDAINNIGFII